MRKYIISILLILSGLIIILNNYFNKKNPTYSENTFAKQAQKFDQTFDAFTNRVKNDASSIKNKYGDTLNIKDSIYNRTIFIDLLKSNSALN